MNTYTLRVLATIEVDAMEFEDAVNALEDRIGVGEDDSDVTVLDLEVYEQ